MIRKDTEWMEMLDERILEYLRDNGSTYPSILMVAKGIRGPEEKIRKRCEGLYQSGFITKNGGKYEISPVGLLYLYGEDSADNLSEKSERFIIHSLDKELTEELNNIYDTDTLYHVSGEMSEKLMASPSEDVGDVDECVVHTFDVNPKRRAPGANDE